MSEEPSSDSLKIKGIPDQSLWVLAALLPVPAILFIYALRTSPPPSKPEEWWISYVVFGIFFMPFIGGALFSAFYCLWARLIANDDGLRWRFFGRWHQATWQEVADYYIEAHPKAKAKRTVVTPSGSINLNLFPKATDQLADAVQNQARQAKACEWGLLGTRPCDEWPQTFTYCPHVFPKFLFQLAVMILVMPLLMWARAGFMPPTQIRIDLTEWLPFIGWPVIILSGIAFLALFLMYPLLTLANLPRIQATKARREQKIVCEPQSIALQGSPQPMEVKWAEITCYYIAPLRGWIDTNGLCVVETTRGNFDFCGIERQPLLMAIIQRYATQASTTQWQSLTNKTDGIMHNPTGAPFPVVHTYRTNTNRAMCWLLTGIVLVFLLGLWLNLDSELPRDNFFIPAIYGFIALCMWLLYYNSMLTRTETGISTSFFGRKASLRWNEIENLDYRNGFFVVSGHGHSLRFSPYIGGARELVNEIERRAVNAQIHPSWNRNTT